MSRDRYCNLVQWNWFSWKVFSCSTCYFHILCDSLNLFEDSRIHVPKLLTTIHMPCRTDAAKAFVHDISQISVSPHAVDVNEVWSAHNARGIYKQMLLLKTEIFAFYWNEILEETIATNTMLQRSKMDINKEVLQSCIVWWAE